MIRIYQLCLLILLLIVSLGCGSPTDGVDNSIEFIDIDLPNLTNVSRPVFSHDGSMVAISGKQPNGASAIRVFNSSTKSLLCEFADILPSGTLSYPINFCDDGTKLLIIKSFDSALVVNPVSGATIVKFYNVSQARLLPNGSGVVMMDKTSSTSLYSATNGSKIKDLSTEQYGHYVMAGTRGSEQIIFTLSSLFEGYQIVHWDIASNSKSSDITITDDISIHSNLFGRFSTDFSVISIASQQNTNIINFYNTQTGKKINTAKFTYPSIENGLQGEIAIANDLTYIVQGYGVQSNSVLPPSVYSLPGCNHIKNLPVPDTANDTRLKNFAFCGNSRFFGAVEYLSTKSPDLSSLRIWKLK